MVKNTLVLTLAIPLLLLTGCGQQAPASQNGDAEPTSEAKEAIIKRKVSQDFKQYWYDGTAEISSYTLEQARYGEMRQGYAMLIFVTEPFNPQKQVKADQDRPENVSVLKLNATKKFVTGIYPYSIMTSTFYPIATQEHALKVSNSVQEWCGQVYVQLNNRKDFEVMSHSYFESEADQQYTLPKAILENELWTQLRLDPKELPQGTFQAIPALEFLRLSHHKTQAYAVTGKLSVGTDSSSYVLNYPELDRSLEISFQTDFPYTILGWTETYPSGFDDKAKMMTTKATQIKTIKTPYWKQNANEYLPLRDSLGI